MRNCLDLWHVKPGYPFMQTLPPHILDHLNKTFGKKDLINTAKSVLENECSEKPQERKHVRYTVSFCYEKRMFWNSSEELAIRHEKDVKTWFLCVRWVPRK